MTGLTPLLIIAAGAVVGAAPDIGPTPRPAPDVGPTHHVWAWAKNPNSDDMLAAYPKAALHHDVAGNVTLRCEVLTNGHLRNCTVEEEIPAKQGFGKAALKLSGKYLRDSDTPDAPPEKAGILHITVAFRPPPKAPPAGGATAPTGTPGPIKSHWRVGQHRQT